jgi:hypothetical protein
MARFFLIGEAILKVCWQEGKEHVWEMESIL